VNCPICQKAITNPRNRFGYCVEHRKLSPEVRAYQQAYRDSHKQERKVYLKANSVDLKMKRNVRQKNRRQVDVVYRFRTNLRTRLNRAIKFNWKVGSAIQDLGCSLVELKMYIEKQFQPGMSWANWGKPGWHIDHIKPISSFDLTNPEQFRAACHYTNLQPMWAEENVKKSNR
jgi:hypothetical protein